MFVEKMEEVDYSIFSQSLSLITCTQWTERENSAVIQARTFQKTVSKIKEWRQVWVRRGIRKIKLS